MTSDEERWRGSIEHGGVTDPPAPPADRSFGILFAGIFLIVGLWPLASGEAIRPWAVALAILLIGLTLAAPIALRPLNRVWFAFGMLLHRIASPLVLALMYFVVLTPAGLLMRWLRRTPLELEFEPETDSYWISREGSSTRDSDLHHQF